MSNWKKFDSHWLNLDYLKELYIQKLDTGQYVIKCLDADNEKWEIFTKVYNDRDAAQNYLDNCMKCFDEEK